MIAAEVIADSVSLQGKRITTLKCVYPKFIHGEFMTHRALSRNASSSRAIPVEHLIREVRDDATRAVPVWWGREQKGMQSGPELEGAELEWAQRYWRAGAWAACDVAENMVRCNVHKSIVNRILEPFSHIRVVATATEWDNFFGLRLDRAAQPEMRTLAEAMWAAMGESTPKLLQPGEWHLPFVDIETVDTIARHGPLAAVEAIAIKISVARCARVSFEDFDTRKRSTVEADLKLYEKLVGAQPLHASPAEHQASPDQYDERQWVNTGWEKPYLHGNFVGWVQYRKMLPGEACAPLPEGYGR